MKRLYGLLLGMGLCTPWIGAQEKGSEERPFLPDALYVRFMDGSVRLPKSNTREVPLNVLFPASKCVDAYGLKSFAYILHFVGREALDRTFEIRFDSVQKAEDLMAELRNDPRVEWVERVPRMEACAVGRSGKPGERMPNDPLFGTVEEVPLSWHLDMVGFKELYGKYEGNPAIKAAVVDNAVWAAHEDLRIAPENLYNCVSKTAGEANPPEMDQEIVYGEEMFAFNPAYNWSHGTHCAGVVGAVTDNGKGIASLASGVTLMGVRVAVSAPNVMDHTILGVLWAAENGARVISMSYGGSYFSTVEQEVYSGCAEQGIVMVAAAGNEHSNTPTHYPAVYPGVISVGSVNSDGGRSDFSNYGDWVDIWAPGGVYVEDDSVMEKQQIFSTTYCVTQFYPEKQSLAGRYYDMMAGTSMATPLVASAAALLLSYYPDLNGYQVGEVLKRTSRHNRIYVPAAFRFLETSAGRQVRHLRAGWDAAGKTLRMRWEAPEMEGVTAYRIYHGEEVLGECAASGFSFSCPMKDTSGFVGVRAVYGSDSGMVAYTRVRPGIPASTDFRPDDVPVYLEVRTDRTEKTLTLFTTGHFDRIEIYNVQGVKVLDLPGGTKRIDMGAFPSGLYIGRAIRAHAVKPFKVVL